MKKHNLTDLGLLVRMVAHDSCELQFPKKGEVAAAERLVKSKLLDKFHGGYVPSLSGGVLVDDMLRMLREPDVFNWRKE